MRANLRLITGSVVEPFKPRFHSSNKHIRLASMKAQNIAAVAVLLLSAQLASAYVDLSKECQGNLLINGGFEEPNTEQKATQLPDPTSNSKWGWYEEIPGWYTARPDGQGHCVKTDWCGTCLVTGKPYIEVGRGALATPIEGKQYGELLPNATGNYCQDIKLQKGAQYKLSYYYGRLMTFKKGTGKWTTFDTAVDVAIRDAGHKPDVNAKAWPGDKQGYSLISQADTADNWAKHNKQWVKHETTFTAPSDMVTLAFINAKRPKECGSCGSLLDAVCLQKV